MNFTRRVRRKPTEADDEEDQIAAEAEAQQSGGRAYHHWRERNEPPSTFSALAMRQSCPFAVGDVCRERFFLGWKLADGSAYEYEVARPYARTDLRGARCRIVQRVDKERVEVEMQGGERLEIRREQIRRISA